MSAEVEKLRNARQRLWDDLAANHASVEPGVYTFTLDEKNKFDRVIAEIEYLDKRIKSVIEEEESSSFRVDKFGRSVCECGYGDECGVHCGNGHDTGDCPSDDLDIEYNQDTFVQDMYRIEQSLQSGVYTRDEARAALPDLNDVHLAKDMSMSRKKLAEVDRRRHAAEVGRFQKEHGLLADGIIGVRTMTAMNEADVVRLKSEFTEKMKSRQPVVMGSVGFTGYHLGTDYFGTSPLTGASMSQMVKSDPNALGPKTRAQVDSDYARYLKLYVEYGEDSYLEQMLECVYV